MKVILIQAVPKVGKKGEVVEVSDGYAANALFPFKKAIPATEKNLAVLNRTVASMAATKALEQGLLESAIKSLPDMSVSIPMKANESGHLFSKVDAVAIVEALERHRIGISVKNVSLKNPIKEIGTYPIGISEGEYRTTISVIVTKEE